MAELLSTTSGNEVQRKWQWLTGFCQRWTLLASKKSMGPKKLSSIVSISKLQDWHIIALAGKSSDTGRVVTAIAKKWVDKRSDIRATVFSKRRVLRTRARSADQEDLADPSSGPLPQKGMIGVACSSQGLSTKLRRIFKYKLGCSCLRYPA